MCQGGNTRSVALKFLLKMRYDIDALACGWDFNTEETRLMLYEWADRIIVLDDDFLQYVPEKFHKTAFGKPKLHSFHVGDDIWTGAGGAFHPELVQMLSAMLDERGSEIFKGLKKIS
jgi:hypothetical protein